MSEQQSKYEYRFTPHCGCDGKSCRIKADLEAKGKKVRKLKDPAGCHLKITKTP